MTADQVACLEQRCQHLALRVAAKRQLGWDATYDQRERDALRAALNKLSRGEIAPVQSVVTHGRRGVFSEAVTQATRDRTARANGK
jgi:hypothetical protein